MNYKWSLRWRLQLRRKVEREKGIPNWMWCIHLPSMSRWRAALYFDITINVSDFFVMFLRVTPQPKGAMGVRKEITLNTTDYNFSILGEITVSLEAIKHNIQFHLLLRQFSVLVRGFSRHEKTVKETRRLRSRFSGVCVDDWWLFIDSVLDLIEQHSSWIKFGRNFRVSSTCGQPLDFFSPKSEIQLQSLSAPFRRQSSQSVLHVKRKFDTMTRHNEEGGMLLSLLSYSP